MTEKLGEFELNKIYCMDCLEGLKKLPNNSIDLVITDPPYGDNEAYGRSSKLIQGNENPLLNCQALVEIERVMKFDSVCYNFTNWKHWPFLENFIIRYTNFRIRMLIVLKKGRFGFGHGFRNQHELIIVLEKGNPVYNSRDFPNVLDFSIVNHNDETHPHEKPRDLIRKIIEHSSNEGNIILDCFSGSGNIMLASKETNRKFIGFEIEDKWINLSNKRLAQEVLKL